MRLEKGTSVRIIGGHDYYDGAVPFDADNSRLFVRTHRECDLVPVEQWHFQIEKRLKPTINSITPVFVIFCGKLYRGIRFEMYDGKSFGYVQHYVWNENKLAEYAVFEKRPKYRWSSPLKEQLYADNLDQYFYPAPVQPELLNTLLDKGVLIATHETGAVGIKPHHWIVNSDNLKKLNFPTVFNAWQAYQELEMFLGTVMVRDENRMVKVSDESLLAKHGFDHWSFKNQVHPNKPRHK